MLTLMNTTATKVFILVTHNKATMSAADVLSGLTMQGEGVSRVVPVDFRALVEA